jgi:hypothetical protein
MDDPIQLVYYSDDRISEDIIFIPCDVCAFPSDSSYHAYDVLNAPPKISSRWIGYGDTNFVNPSIYTKFLLDFC